MNKKMIKKGGMTPGNPSGAGYTMGHQTGTLAAQGNRVANKGSSASYQGVHGSHSSHTHNNLSVGKPCKFIDHHQAGGASSDWRSTNYSRGPVNYPRNGWFNGQQMFKQFSKTAQYIPNDKLAHSVAPKSTGIIKDHSPVGRSISGWTNSYANY